MGINNKSNLRLKKKKNQTKICPLVLPFLPTLTKILTLFINPNQRHRVIYLEKKKRRTKTKYQQASGYYYLIICCHIFEILQHLKCETRNLPRFGKNWASASEVWSKLWPSQPGISSLNFSLCIPPLFFWFLIFVIKFNGVIVYMINLLLSITFLIMHVVKALSINSTANLAYNIPFTNVQPSFSPIYNFNS